VDSNVCSNVQIFERGLKSLNYTNYKSVLHNVVVEGGLVVVTGHAQGKLLGYKASKLLVLTCINAFKV